MFTDVNQKHWAYSNIALANMLGIMRGYPDGTFKPDQGVTRAEVATVTMRGISLGVGLGLMGGLLIGAGAYMLTRKKAA